MMITEEKRSQNLFTETLIITIEYNISILSFICQTAKILKGCNHHMQFSWHNHQHYIELIEMPYNDLPYTFLHIFPFLVDQSGSNGDPKRALGRYTKLD